MAALPGKAWLILLLALPLVACSQPQGPSQAPSPDTPTSSWPEPRSDLPEEQRLIDLFGAWVIESAGAAPGPRLLHEGWNMVLLVGNGQLEVLSQCVTIGPFDYGRTEGGGIAVSQQRVRPSAPPHPHAPAPAMCAGGLLPAEQAVPQILFGARDVERQPDGSVRIRGDAGNLAFRRPSGALENPRGQAPPPAVPPLLGAWRVLAVNDKPLVEGQQMELLLRSNHIEWRSGCVNEVRLLARDRDRLLPGDAVGFPVCERGQSEAEVAFGRLTAAPIETRMTAAGRLRLHGSGVTAELEPLTR